MNQLKNKKGFTLIEMVIVIVIIAILAAILVPSLLSYVNSAQEKKLMTAGDTIRKAILTELAEMEKDGEAVNGTKSSDKTTFDDDFWEMLSTNAGATVKEFSSTEEAKYYIYFEVTDNTVLGIKITDGSNTLTLSDGAWVKVAGVAQ